MRSTLLSVIGVAFAAYLALSAPIGVEGQHKDNGHSGYLYSASGVDQYEMNSRTTNAQSIPIQLAGGVGIPSPTILSSAISNWNSGMFSATNFNVYSSGSGYITVYVDSTSQCSPTAHGCVKDWNPTTPAANIRMVGSKMTTDNHRLSDLMHEMGHVLRNASDHYPTYDCTSIMGHSSNENSSPGSQGGAGWCGQGEVVDGPLPALVKTTVLGHDVTDYVDAYGVEDDQNATYINMLGSATTVHYFEGGYLGGNGRAAHQEFENVIDRSTGGITGTYYFYYAVGRRVDNTDNTTPENQSFTAVPTTGSQWCFKIHAHAKGIKPGSATEWGPFSKRYCIARSGSGNGVFVTSDRNGTAKFRVWNFSGGTITNVQLRTAPSPGTQICAWSSVSNNSVSSTCSASISGPSFLNVWYNGTWEPLDTIDYDQ